MAEKSERTRRLEEAKIEDDPLYFKRAIRGATLGMSRAADKMGIGTDKKEEPVKKAKGGLLAPSKKVLAKSGFYDKDKTKSEREKIVGKVTTKPQRVKMVEKMFSTKKPKKYAEGGLAGLAENAESLMGEVDGMANTINYGSSTATGSGQPLGLQAVSGFKKGGTVKSSASKRGDGIALRGKTRGKVV